MTAPGPGGPKASSLSLSGSTHEDIILRPIRFPPASRDSLHPREGLGARPCSPLARPDLVRARGAQAGGVLKAAAGGGAAQSSRRLFAVAWNSAAWRPVRACADMASNGMWGREAAMARPGEASSLPGQTWGFSAGPVVAGEGGLPHLCGGKRREEGRGGRCRHFVWLLRCL